MDSSTSSHVNDDVTANVMPLVNHFGDGSADKQHNALRPLEVRYAFKEDANISKSDPDSIGPADSMELWSSEDDTNRSEDLDLYWSSEDSSSGDEDSSSGGGAPFPATFWKCDFAIDEAYFDTKVVSASTKTSAAATITTTKSFAALTANFPDKPLFFTEDATFDHDPDAAAYSYESNPTRCYDWAEIRGETTFPYTIIGSKQHYGRWGKGHVANDLLSLAAGRGSYTTQRTISLKYEVIKDEEDDSSDEYGSFEQRFEPVLIITNNNPLQHHETRIHPTMLRKQPEAEAHVVTLFLRKREKCTLAFKNAKDTALFKGFVDEMFDVKTDATAKKTDRIRDSSSISSSSSGGGVALFPSRRSEISGQGSTPARQPVRRAAPIACTPAWMSDQDKRAWMGDFLSELISQDGDNSGELPLV
tara:strand:+ start:232 stop:1485 length:1254 start_codon:yes stop_codon:yes gene_type:complete